VVRGWRIFLVGVIPAIALSWIAFIVTGVVLSRVCLEEWPIVISLLGAIPFVLPAAIYFAIDHSLFRTFLILILVTIPLAIAIPSTEGAPERSKQRETLHRMRTIMTAIEVHVAKTNRRPDAKSISDLERQLGEPLPEVDAWCHPFAVSADANGYEIVSYGLGGVPDALPYVYGRTYKLEDDIVAKDGSFLRAPEGMPEH